MTNQLQLSGFVHNVSPTKKSKIRSFPYFTFSLQVSDNTIRRAVCYDNEKQPIFKAYEESRQPAILTNVTQKRSLLDPSQDDVIVSKRSRIQDASNTDIDFKYLENSEIHDSNTVTLIGNIPSLSENTITSIQGVVTMSLEHIKEITTKTADTIPMLDHCVVTDNTGTIRLTLWGSTIKEITNNDSYMITNLRVKSFDAKKYLTTTPTTTIQAIEETFPPPTEEYFDSFFKLTTIYVDKITLAENFKTWLSCSKCARQLPELTSSQKYVVKCTNCEATQPLSSCAMAASVRIAVKQEENQQPIWLTAFNQILEEMLDNAPETVSIKSSEEDIYTNLFKLSNFTLAYSDTSHVIKNISF